MQRSIEKINVTTEKEIVRQNDNKVTFKTQLATGLQQNARGFADQYILIQKFQYQDVSGKHCDLSQMQSVTDWKNQKDVLK